MKKVIIVGGGAAGLMAAVSAAEQGAEVIILEKMATIGRKMAITGKGRCNITNSTDVAGLIKNMTGNGAFLYSAYHEFDNNNIIEFLAKQGVPTKVERGGRVFPESDKAQDVIMAFMDALVGLKVNIMTGQKVAQLIVRDNMIKGIKSKDNKVFEADAVILATGGASYPGTGSSGDGYIMAEKIGHTIIPLKPSLVPLETEEEWVKEVQGLSLRNVTATVVVEGQKVAQEFGEMLFTHYGVSGPIILSLSKKVAELLEKNIEDITLEINLKPALTPEKLDKRIQRDFDKFKNKQIKNALGELLPGKLINVVIDLSFIDADKEIHQVTKKERQRLMEVVTALTLTITGTRKIDEAIVTAGGINVKEINPKTMESKLIQNLYFAGEVIDIDGYTGGFNLQAAFSTGYVAGKNAAY